MKQCCAKLCVVWLFLISANSGFSAQAQDAPKPKEEILTNEAIVTLTKAGMIPQLIISKILSSQTHFDVTIEKLLRLKEEKVADEVVNVMIQVSHTEAKKKAEIENIPSKPDPNNPSSPHEAGIYFSREEDEQQELVQIDPAIYSQAKSGGFFTSAMTYGIAKIKSKAVIAGARAKLQVHNARPVFYFYFEVTGAGLSNSGHDWGGTSTSPNEFVLVRMEVKKNSRELVVGQMNAFGAQSGALDKYVQPFDYEKLSPGIFKVTPKGNLTEGEYCFFYGGATPLPTYGMIGATGGGKVFDFGVKKAQAQ